MGAGVPGVPHSAPPAREEEWGRGCPQLLREAAARERARACRDQVTDTK